MGKVLGIILFIVLALIAGLLINLLIDLIVIVFKKLSSKLRMLLGIPAKVPAEAKDVPAPAQEKSENSNSLIQKILAKRQSSGADETQKQEEKAIEVTEYEEAKE